MSDEALFTDAIRRRDAAMIEVRRWDGFIRSLRELRPDLQLEDLAPLPPVRRFISAQALAEQRRQMSAQVSGAIAETQAAAVQILRQFNRPIPTKELLAEIEKAGITIGGQDPPSTLSARLSRAPLVENVRPHGWRLREVIPDRDEAEGAPSKEVPSASGPTPNSADQDGREVEHENTGLTS